MVNNKISILWIPCICILFVLSFGERVADHIYLKLDGGKQHCFLLLNATNQVGCQSKRDGNQGVVVYITNREQFDRLDLLYDNSTKFIISLDTVNLDKVVVENLRNDRVQGILLFNSWSNETDLSFSASEDSYCPNSHHGYYNGSCKQWNRESALSPEGLRFIDWQKPIFLIENRTEIDIIVKNCYVAFNINGSTNKRSLCYARMKHFMRAAGNARLCLRRQNLPYSVTETGMNLCDPLEEKNIFSIIPPPVLRSSDAEKPKFISLAARIDSFSLLTNSAVGDISTLTSLISVLAVAKAVGDNREHFISVANSTNRALMLSFFHGESLGYIGSSRTVVDMRNGKFPFHDAKENLMKIRIEDIHAFIEIQQLSGSQPDLFAHIDSRVFTGHRKEMIDRLISKSNDALAKLATKPTIKVANRESNAQVPPSSYQTFLKENSTLIGFVIAPFQHQYDFKHLNSFADNRLPRKAFEAVKKQIVASSVAALAAITEFIYDFPKTSSISTYEIDEEFVGILLDCFIYSLNWNSCDFFKKLLSQKNFNSENMVKSTYIFTGYFHRSPVRILVDTILVYCLGVDDINNVTSKQCESLNRPNEVFRYVWQDNPALNTTTCYRTSTYEMLAISPAFDYGYNSLLTNYSSWVESIWSRHELQLFLVHQHSSDLIVFCAGLVFLFTCWLIMECICVTNKNYFDPNATSMGTDVCAVTGEHL